MANAHLAYPDLALDKFSGTDPDQDAEALIRLIECKINFVLGTEPDEADDAHVIYLFRKKALFSSLLRGPAAEWYGSTIQDAKTWNEVRTLFITRFSDAGNKFRHGMEVEHCLRADGEKIRNFLHRIKKTVDKSWPDDLVGVVAADQASERTAQARQRRQRYIDNTLKGLRPRYFQRMAQKYSKEPPKVTWNDFSTHLINKDVSYQVSTSFLNDEEQNRAQTASLRQELRNLRTELQQHRIIALEGNQRPVDPNQREDRMLQGSVGIAEPMDILLITVEKKYEMMKSRSCKMKPQPRKKLRSPKITTRGEDLPTDLGIGLDGTMVMGL